MKNLIPTKAQGIAVLVILFCLSFTQAFATKPIITGFSPTSGPTGTMVTITGSNFNTTADNNIVYFGANRATVSSVTATSLSVIVPVGATYEDFSVTDIATGLTGYSSQPFVVTFDGSPVFIPTSFASKVDFPTIQYPNITALKDLNGDGKPDFLTISGSYNSIAVFQNTSTVGSISFANLNYTYYASGYPHSILFSDLDGDGKPDLAYTGFTSSTVYLWGNTSTLSSISFNSRGSVATGQYPTCLSAGDIDGDGKPDIVVVDNSAHTLFSVLLNASTPGSFSFTSNKDVETGEAIADMSIGDLNGDNKPDLVLVNSSNSSISIYINTSTTGSVSFASKLELPTGKYPNKISIGDLDGDGKPDLAVVNNNDNTISIFKNISTPDFVSFAPKIDFATGKGPQCLSISDLDGDGKPDLSVTNSSDKTLSVLKNTSIPGTISFASGVNYTTSKYPNEISTGDLDGDGKPDIAVANSSDNTISIFRNRVMSPPILTSFTPTAATSGDTINITGTNLSEIDALSFGGTKAYSITEVSPTNLKAVIAEGATGYISVTNTGGIDSLSGFTYTTPPALTINSFTPASAKPGETVSITGTHLIGTSSVNFGSTPAVSYIVESDTLLKAIVGEGSTGSIEISNPGSTASLSGFLYIPKPTISSFTPASDSVGASVTFTGKGFNSTAANNIVFFGATQASVSSATDSALTVNVPSGATYQDISVLNKTTGLTGYTPQPFITTFDGSTAFDAFSFEPKTDFTTGTAPKGVALSDLDGDGKPDMVTANYSSNNISIFQNTGTTDSISFAPKLDLATGYYPSKIVIEDVNSDGKPDIVVTNYSSNTVSVFRNISVPGTISFTVKTDYATDNSTGSVAINDLDGDGKPDMVVTNPNNNIISIFKNTSSAGAVSFATKVDYAIGSYPYDIAIADLDGDGKPDLTISLESSDSVSVLRNTSVTGSISFAPRVDFQTTKNPYNVAIGDLDGDGKPDIVCSAYNTTVSILKNNSTAGILSFAAKVDYSLDSNSSDVAIGDLDGDGKPDLAIPNSGNTVSVLKNTSTSGIISFASQTSYTTGTNPSSISIGDLSGDGKPDLVVTNYSDNTVSILKNAIIPAPEIASFTPSTAVSGTSINIIGLNFTGASAVSFGNMPADSFTVVSDTCITAIVGNGASGSVSVTRPAGGPGSLDGFHYLLKQTITFYSFSPQTYGTPDFDPGATASSSLAVIYTSSNDSVVTIISNQIHTTGIGSCTIYANQAGDSTYAAAPQTSQDLTVNTKSISITGVTAENKVYDGTTPASLTGGILSGVVNSDNVTLIDGSGQFANKNVGTGKTVTATGYAITGIDAGKYILSSQPDSLTADITPASLTISGVTAENKVYDDTTTATLTGGTLSGIIESDDVVLTPGRGQFANKNVGTGITVTATGYTLSGTDSANYIISAQPSGLTADITPKSLTITSIAAGNKAYDGTTTATITGGTLSGILGSDDVTLTDGTGTFADKNVGNGKIVTATGYTLTGNNAENYILSAQPAGLSADITPASLTINGVTAENKVYDGTTDVTLTGGTLSGIFGSDDVTLTNGTGEFADKNVGTGKTVTTTGYALAGNDVGNYVLTSQPSGVVADITPAPLTTTGITAEDKVYDGTIDATLTGGSLDGIIGSDDVTLTDGTGAFADKNVGIGKTVSAAGYDLSGTDAGNYTLSVQPSALTADITPAPLTIQADSGQTKIVGEADPVFAYTLTNGSVIAGDSITGALTRTSGETAGNYPIEIGTLTAGDNYDITFIPADFIIKTTTDVPSVSADIPNAYPNPTKGLVTLNVPDGKVTITNLNGTVLDETSLAYNKTINLNGFAPGVYILILKTKDAIYKYKIIKQ